MVKNIWRRSFLVAFLAGSVTLVNGQYNIVPLPVGNIYLKSQLWSLSVSNTGTSTVDAKIQLDMRDIRTHQAVLTAVSASFRVSPGVKMVQAQAMEPILYNYGSGAVTDRSSNGMLPIGQYQVCYQLLISYGKNQTAAADDCEEIEVTPLSPPLLTMPENDSLLTTTTPYFTWTPPAPMTMFGELGYDLLISPVHDGQSITDAIQKNLPLQQAQGLSQPFFSYPLQGAPLEEGKIYAWQIIARDHQQYAAKSEVWSFRVPDKKASATSNSLVYLLMDGNSNGTVLVEPGILHVKYVSYSTAHEAPVVFKDEKGAVLQTTQQVIRQGDNYLDIPMNGRFQSKHIYIVLISDKGGKTNSLSFSIK